MIKPGIQIFESYNGALYLDATYIAQKPEFSTNKYGFGYCTFTLALNERKAMPLFTLTKVAYIRIGEAARSYFEGRLEVVELTKEGVKLTAYGYWRALTDLQVTDLWSTTDYGKWIPTKRELSVGTAYDDKSYNFFNDKELFIGVKNNTAYGNAPSNYASLEYYLPSGYLRKFQAVTFLSSGNITNSFVYGITSRDLPGTATAYGTAQPTTGNALTLTNFFPDKAYVHIYYARIATNALYVGEDNGLYASIKNLRIGTTPSISGSRLYADEILRFYCSGVYSLNTNMINNDLSGITSPGYDLTDIEFRNQTALDVVETLLTYPDTESRLYEFKIWENQKPLFRVKTSPKTWYIQLDYFEAFRDLQLYFNTINITYKSLNGYDTTYQQITPGYINRQTALSLSTSDTAIVGSAATAALADYQRKPPRTEISTQKVMNPGGSLVSAIEVRSGDTIVITNIPMELKNVIDNTFIVAETLFDLETEVARIIPELPIVQLESLLSKVKL